MCQGPLQLKRLQFFHTHGTCSHNYCSDSCLYTGSSTSSIIYLHPNWELGSSISSAVHLHSLQSSHAQSLPVTIFWKNKVFTAQDHNLQPAFMVVWGTSCHDTFIWLSASTMLNLCQNLWHTSLEDVVHCWDEFVYYLA